MDTDSDFPGLVANAQAMEQSGIAHPQVAVVNALGFGVPLFAAGVASLSRFSRTAERVPSSESSSITERSVRGRAINR